MTAVTAITLASILTFAVAGCTSPRDQREPDTSATRAAEQPLNIAPIATATEFVLRDTTMGYAGIMPYTYTNRTDDTVFVVNCNGDVSPGLQRKTGDTWENWWNPGTDACLSPPLKIAPGASYNDTLAIVISPQEPMYYDELRSSSGPGTYRLIWHHALASFDGNARPFGALLAIEQRVSNAFVLTTE